MALYAGVIYPATVGWCLVLLVVAIATLVRVRLHPILEWVVTGMWIVTGIQAIAVVIALLSGNDAGIVLTVGYLLATVAVLPLLGIGRLGAPDAAAADPDPNRPVLAPDQIARVDAGAAAIVAVTAAVLAWRIAVLLGAA
ncbi:hypothetical protein [Demequina sp. NBRC 110053]|uniref:hypothetical protein n=1 Tax=Demequina sp. NBRC 110053 TaxID=1570342 RepID=UPI000A002513|nr:hypothetical protein [Demequina sp. NBRC 110053]